MLRLRIPRQATGGGPRDQPQLALSSKRIGFHNVFSFRTVIQVIESKFRKECLLNSYNH